MKKSRKQNRIMTLFVLQVLLVFSSCKPRVWEQALTEQAQKRLPPLETVHRLAEENKQFETNPAKSTSFHSQEIKTILDKGYIVFGMAAVDQKPFKYIEAESGELIGLDVEIAYTIANRMGVKAVFNRSATSFDGVVQLVADKKADIALSKLSLTTRRAELARFTKPYIILRQALLLNRLEYAKLGSEDQLPNFIKNYRGTLGVVNNSSYVNYAVTNFPNADIEKYENWDETVNALFYGKVLAIYRDEGEILTIITNRKDASILMKPIIISDKRDPIAMAVSAEAPLLQDWLNIFLDDYMIQNREELTPARLIERHFGREGL